MRAPRRRFLASAAELRDGLDRIRTEQQLVDGFPPEALAEAETAARRGPVSPGSAVDAPRADLRELPFVTVDPPGSRDLDQAFHLERRGRGYRLRYAIADVASFVTPGGALDAETRRRGVTLYAPDARSPLHPPVLGEGAASLLPDVERPAVVWTVDLDADGVATATTVGRAWVRSRRALAYAEVQAVVDGDAPGSGLPEGVTVLLREVGIRRLAVEAARGGVSLALPEQDVVGDDGAADDRAGENRAGGDRAGGDRAGGDRAGGEGPGSGTHADRTFALEYRRPLPVERWNAQLSLLTGIEAAQLMAGGGLALLRTLPPAAPDAFDRLRRSAAALGVAWPDTTPYADWIRSLDAADPRHAALLEQAARTLRGAGYAVVRDTADLPVHAALAAPYAHVTAPLRRLVDRFATELAVAAHEGRDAPAWVVEALDELPRRMGVANQRAATLDRAVLDLVEALVLRPHVGETFAAAVVAVDDGTSRVQLVDPAVITTVAARLPLGRTVTVRLDEVDVAAARIRLSPVD